MFHIEAIKNSSSTCLFSVWIMNWMMNLIISFVSSILFDAQFSNEMFVCIQNQNMY